MAKNFDSKTIYDIFRSCRLCGSGGGYKMPIILSVIGIEFNDIDIRQKIRECLQIEVQEGDKMPPLICERCVDKLNDFHEFLQMCKDTNDRTRKRLGLPSSNFSRGSSSEKCILGVTEPVFPNNTNTSDKPKKPKLMGPKCKREEKERLAKLKLEEGMAAKAKEEEKRNAKQKKKEHKLNKELLALQPEGYKPDLKSSREFRHPRVKPEQAFRPTRSSSSLTESEPTSGNQNENLDSDDDTLIPRVKRTRDKNQIKLEIPSKRVKITLNIPQKPQSPPPKTERSRSNSTKDTESSRSKSTKDTESSRSKSTKDTESSRSKSTKDTESSRSKSTKDTESSRSKSTKDTESSRSKSTKDTESSSSKSTKDTESSRVKLTRDSSKDPRPKEPQKGSPKDSKPAKECKAPAARFSCAICETPMKNPQALVAHLRVHTVKYTDPELACNACGEWFETATETSEHHKKHRTKTPYRCRHCKVKYKSIQTYDAHIANCLATNLASTPDVQCQKCMKYFITDTLRKQHKCLGGPASCENCNKPYGSKKALNKHKKTCHIGAKKVTPPVSVVKIPAKLRRRLKPTQVRLVRCDSILKKKGRSNTFNVAKLKEDFGLDKKCIYPYMNLCTKANIKSEPLAFDGMVSIQQEIKDEFYREEDYVHWDSDLSSDSDFEEGTVDEFTNKKIKKVPSLITLSLKTIYSKRCLGKVPRKLRKIKQDQLFESLFTCDDNLADNNLNIGQLIDNLRDDDDAINDASEINNVASDKKSDSETNVLVNNAIDKVKLSDENYDSDSLDKSILNNINFETENYGDGNDNDKNHNENINDNEINNDRDENVNDTNINDNEINNDRDENVNDGEKNVDASQNVPNDNVTEDATQDTNINFNESETDVSINGEEAREETFEGNNLNGGEENDRVEEKVANGNLNGELNGDFDNDISANYNDRNDNLDDSNFNDKSDNDNDKLMAALNEHIGEGNDMSYSDKDYGDDVDCFNFDV